MSFQFWRRWLIVVTGGVLIYGFSLIVLPNVAKSFFSTMMFSSPDAMGVFDEAANDYITFVHSVLGAVLIGWMLTVLYIVIGSFQPGQRHTWNTLAAAIGTWYIIDSGYSLYSGAVAHAIFNTLFLLLFVIPLAATYGYFRAEASLT
jgi:hypothetical protein